MTKAAFLCVVLNGFINSPVVLHCLPTLLVYTSENQYAIWSITDEINIMIPEKLGYKKKIYKVGITDKTVTIPEKLDYFYLHYKKKFYKVEHHSIDGDVHITIHNTTMPENCICINSSHSFYYALINDAVVAIDCKDFQLEEAHSILHTPLLLCKQCKEKIVLYAPHKESAKQPPHKESAKQPPHKESIINKMIYFFMQPFVSIFKLFVSILKTAGMLVIKILAKAGC
jgi:hypothetical protein